MDLIVESTDKARWKGREIPCEVGKKGFSAAEARLEGMLTTPIGCWKIREVFYRADKVEKIETCFPLRALQPDDGWCDSPSDTKNYNKFVKLPHPASAESLWRNDNLYDIIAVLGFNDDPPVSGRGSAIFLHVAHDGFTGTAGCVALAKEELLRVLSEASLSSEVIVRPLA